MPESPPDCATDRSEQRWGNGAVLGLRGKWCPAGSVPAGVVAARASLPPGSGVTSCRSRRPGGGTDVVGAVGQLGVLLHREYVGLAEALHLAGAQQLSPPSVQRRCALGWAAAHAALLLARPGPGRACAAAPVPGCARSSSRVMP